MNNLAEALQEICTLSLSSCRRGQGIRPQAVAIALPSKVVAPAPAIFTDREGRCLCDGDDCFANGECFAGCEIEIVTETNRPFLSCSIHSELPEMGARPAKYDRLSQTWQEYR